MARNFIVMFDGTWDNQEQRTNVTRMRESIASLGEEDPEQPCFYDAGVGTHWYDRLSGGAFGRGLSRNICQGYQWLASRHSQGDDVYVFGFSRGAYTARSLVGLIRKCGLLVTPTDSLTSQAYDLYRDKEVHPDSHEAVRFRASFSGEIRVKFIGVWDTVGALGIPLSYAPFSRDYYQWHDTELSKIVDYAYHAIATDEHREDFRVAVWTKIKAQNKAVEQRWFVGAHANVGGGYENDRLPDRPLRWLQDKAQSCGLKLSSKEEITADDYRGRINDSYDDFMYGLYKYFRHEYNRVFGLGVNETIDDSVWLRWQEDASYRPASLARQSQGPSP